jgi:hypothetical protein
MTPSRTRSARFKRPRNLPPLDELTERQKIAIRIVYDYGRITTDQLVALMPGSQQKNRRILRTLWWHRYLNRKKISNNDPILYSPAKRGAEMIAEERQLPNSGVEWTTRNRELKPISIPHTRGINDLRFALDMSLQQLPEAEMLFWYPDRTFRKTVTYTVDFERKTKRCTPDGFWGASYRMHRFGGLMEFDNSTMAGTTKREESRIFDKLEALWNLWLQWRDRAYDDRLGVDSLRLFYITKSEQRKENIRELARSVGDQKNGSDFFWFACQKPYQKNPFAVLDAIWQTPRDDTYKSMFDHSAGLSAALAKNAPDDLGPFPLFPHLPPEPSPSVIRSLLSGEVG